MYVIDTHIYVIEHICSIRQICCITQSKGWHRLFSLYLFIQIWNDTQSNECAAAASVRYTTSTSKVWQCFGALVSTLKSYFSFRYPLASAWVIPFVLSFLQVARWGTTTSLQSSFWRRYLYRRCIAALSCSRLWSPLFVLTSILMAALMLAAS